MKDLFFDIVYLDTLQIAITLFMDDNVLQVIVATLYSTIIQTCSILIVLAKQFNIDK